MDNSAFRNLIKQDGNSTGANKGASSSKASLLGSRARAAIPMTPRSLGGQNSSKSFTRQVADHERDADGQPALKKFKTAAAPKGTKLAKGYEDRTSVRRQHEEEQTDKEKKLKELEAMVKTEKIDQATFEKLRDSMGVGGDLGSTHLVKGLDRKLLERIRRGDDLNAAPAQDSEPSMLQANLDDELDSALDKDFVTETKPAAENQEVGSTEAANAVSQSVSRDEILRRLKQSRSTKPELQTVPEPVLSDKFKKLPSAVKSGKHKYVESVNGRRREVLVITDKQGNAKRKTRWIDPEVAAHTVEAAPMGMEVPAELAAKQKALQERQAAEEEDDDDIFAGVGADYDPLKDIESDSDNEESEPPQSKDETPASVVEQKPRNYFGTASATEAIEDKVNSVAQNPTILAALKRAAAIRQGEERGEPGDEEVVDTAQAEKRKQFMAKLKQREREDAQDMDLGFGESRFGDEDDEEGAIWEGDEEQGDKKSGRKRGPKKRKGDKDSVADVMKVLDGRKKA